jgi:hypothetical protein
MYSKSQFYDLEIMCRERAAAARKEMDYWLSEAEEWARFRRLAICNGLIQASPLDPPSSRADMLVPLVPEAGISVLKWKLPLPNFRGED